MSPCSAIPKESMASTPAIMIKRLGNNLQRCSCQKHGSYNSAWATRGGHLGGSRREHSEHDTGSLDLRNGRLHESVEFKRERRQTHCPCSLLRQMQMALLHVSKVREAVMGATRWPLPLDAARLKTSRWQAVGGQVTASVHRGWAGRTMPNFLPLIRGALRRDS